MDSWRNYHKWSWLLIPVLLIPGCNRRDTEKLANIGNIVSERTRGMLAEFEDDLLKRWQRSKGVRRQNMSTK